MKDRKREDQKGRVYYSFWADPELKRTLKAVAALSGESISDTINRALHEFVEHNHVKLISDDAGK